MSTGPVLHDGCERRETVVPLWRWRSELLEQGSDPDPRFTLANERTFLAWVRTALAFMAGGVGLEALARSALSDQVRTPLAVLLVLLGALLAATAFGRWLAAERAMRRKEPLPLPVTAPLLALGTLIASLVLVVAFVAG
jgi:putative membrane protein